LNWQQANDYCASLHVNGFADWRLPTLDEVKDAIEIIRVNPLPVCPSADIAIYHGCRNNDLMPGTKYTALTMRGGIKLFDFMAIWTATQSQTDSKSAWRVYLSPIPDTYLSLVGVTKDAVPPSDSKSTWEAALDSVPAPFARSWFSTIEMTQEYPGAICVRPMEPDLLQAAKVTHPVADLQALQTYIPLNKARLAYQSGNYQESITQAQTAVSLKADPATAYWGIGISYGRLGKWDQALTNLQSALNLDKNYADAKSALKWAKDGQKVARKNKQPKEKDPEWN
jgi:hypothetical protein